MKAELETLPVGNPGVQLKSETEKEKDMLTNIWNSKGGLCEFTRLPDKNVQVVIVPGKDPVLGKELDLDVRYVRDTLSQYGGFVSPSAQFRLKHILEVLENVQNGNLGGRVRG